MTNHYIFLYVNKKCKNNQTKIHQIYKTFTVYDHLLLVTQMCMFMCLSCTHLQCGLHKRIWGAVSDVRAQAFSQDRLLNRCFTPQFETPACLHVTSQRRQWMWTFENKELVKCLSHTIPGSSGDNSCTVITTNKRGNYSSCMTKSISSASM